MATGAKNNGIDVESHVRAIVEEYGIVAVELLEYELALRGVQISRLHLIDVLGAMDGIDFDSLYLVARFHGRVRNQEVRDET
jgi:hypothetical protein